LRRFRPDRLLEFLRPFSEYLSSRGVALPTGAHPAIDYDALAHVLMTTDKSTPADLVESLYFVHEMATQQGMDDLLGEAAKHGIHLNLGDDSSPGDVALEMWLARPDLVQRRHAERRLQRRRNFESFKGCRAPTDSRREGPDHAHLAALEKDLGTWFDEHLRGSWCRIVSYPDGTRTLYMVRHGDAMHREPSVAEGKPSVALYRPELFDILAYDAERDELWINAEDRVRDEYRRRFGAHLFGDADYFPPATRFTLEPLRQNGRAALVCSDVSGIGRVHLVEIEYQWRGALSETVVRRAPDLLAVLERYAGIPAKADIIGAKFKILFSDCKQWRTVRVEVPNKAQFKRDDSLLVEDWLRKREFVVTSQNNGPSPDTVLEGTRDDSVPVSG